MWPNIGADSDAPHIRIVVFFYMNNIVLYLHLSNFIYIYISIHMFSCVQIMHTMFKPCSFGAKASFAIFVGASFVPSAGARC